MRVTSSGRFELTPSSVLPTLLECSMCCSWRRGGDSGVWMSQRSWLKLQTPVPMDFEPTSHESSPDVHDPLNSKAPIRPDSVP